MSENNEGCPLYNPMNCREYYNPKICAFVKEDQVCLKQKKSRKKTAAPKTDPPAKP